MGLSLAGRWALNLACQMEWLWEQFFNLRLDIPLTCFLYWKFVITLAHGKDIWLDFQLAEWLA